MYGCKPLFGMELLEVVMSSDLHPFNIIQPISISSAPSTGPGVYLKGARITPPQGEKKNHSTISANAPVSVEG